jgi:hypothetical protein
VNSIVYVDVVNTAEDLLNVYRWSGELGSCANSDSYPAMFEECPPADWLDYVTFERVRFSEKVFWT